MNAGAWFLLGLAAVAAAGDWWAVAFERKAVEYLCKPLTLALLIGVAVVLDPNDSSVRGWFVVALVWSLFGDVFLMLPRDLFVAGLASFLLAHIAYIVGMWIDGQQAVALALGVVIAGVGVVVIGRRILRAVRGGEQADMAAPVTAYMTIISLMLASATGTRQPLVIGGAALFYASDATIAWGRFVRARPWHRLAIIVSYHLAQVGLTLSLLR